MRKNFGVNTWMFPMPVLIIGTYDENGNPNAMTAAWGGIHDTNQLGVCIDPGHKTAENLQLHKCFSVGIGDAAHVKECDYVGLVSGKDEPEKFKTAGFHAVKSEFIHAPLIEEFPMTVECRLLSYDTKAGCAVGEIVNISIDEKYLDADGRVSVEKMRPICFDPVHHLYRELGAVAGHAFQDGLTLKK